MNLTQRRGLTRNHYKKLQKPNLRSNAKRGSRRSARHTPSLSPPFPLPPSLSKPLSTHTSTSTLTKKPTKSSTKPHSKPHHNLAPPHHDTAYCCTTQCEPRDKSPHANYKHQRTCCRRILKPPATACAALET
ncbi:hypothetical protein KC19_3G196300 [Ceratodon purpureus]|uniref:Uncharacterized protein n=1 Tax=Ceratodon purpureus TaxID=3225 RepID=A0A8T0INU5_CERPU|nr:hypothetical protein KC19_3G196300 [Ceratodon purpureus]